MTENKQEPTSAAASGERYKFLVVVLTVFTTIVTAIVASLQADANIRASSNNIASQEYAIQTSSELQRQGIKSAYDINVMSGYLKDAQEGVVFEMTALEQEETGDSYGAALSRLKAEVAQARADKARLFSIFFGDPRYAPETEEALPDSDAYLADLLAQANELAEKQNFAADEYIRWNNKADAYTGVLTILSVAFFQFGLAQALSPRLRLLFALFGLITLVGSMVWTMIIMLM